MRPVCARGVTLSADDRPGLAGLGNSALPNASRTRLVRAWADRQSSRTQNVGNRTLAASNRRSARRPPGPESAIGRTMARRLLRRTLPRRMVPGGSRVQITGCRTTTGTSRMKAPDRRLWSECTRWTRPPCWHAEGMRPWCVVNPRPHHRTRARLTSAPRQRPTGSRGDHRVPRTPPALTGSFESLSRKGRWNTTDREGAR